MTTDTHSPTERSKRPEAGARSDRLPSIEAIEVDRLNLEAALRDFETANARVVDLTSRLTLTHEALLNARHELSLVRIGLADVEELRSRVLHLETERDAARAEVDMYRLSRSYRIGFKITRLLRKVMP